MAQLLLVLVGALVVGAIGFGIAALIFGGDPGLVPAEPDGRAVPLPRTRPLVEADIAAIRFDTGLRGYRMNQVDAALRRVAYDLGYKEELINVLEAEVAALRDGRADDAELLRRAREAASTSTPAIDPADPDPADPDLAKTDLAKTDLAKTEAAKTDLAKTEAAKTDLAKPPAQPAAPEVLDEPADGQPFDVRQQTRLG
jgi:DivIVA domain-containing protein